MNIFFYLVVSIVLFNINSVTVVLANDTVDYSSSMSMTPIDSEKNNMDSIQGISDISINAWSWSDCSGSVPNTMFTIFPSDNDKDGSSGGGGGVTVETSPANLITVTNDWCQYSDCDGSDGRLIFEWNKNVSSIATYGGVRIGVPSDQLLYVSVGYGHNVQILDGFTNITYLSVSDDDSILHALMTTSISSSLYLSNAGGYIYLKTNIPVDSGFSLIQGGGKSYVETPSYDGLIWVKGVDSELNIKGDMNVSTTNSSEVYGGAQLTVTGTITGTIYNSENSTVNTPSCDNVISDGDNSTCNAGPQTVDVDLSQNSIQTLNGTRTRSCDDGNCPSYCSDSSSSSSSTHVCLSVIIIAVAAAAVASTSMLI